VEKEGKSQEKPDLRHDPPIGFSSRGTRDRPCEMAFHLSASPFLGERGGEGGVHERFIATSRDSAGLSF